VTNDSSWVAGVGASAISCLPNGYSQNSSDAARYMAAIAAGGFATARGIAVNAEDRLRGEIIGLLMCCQAVNIAEACSRFGIESDSFIASAEGLAPLLRDGLITMTDGQLAVTDRGRPLVRYICAAFDRHYADIEGKHTHGV
jgi:oxygen-independent coproporphyrinogen III oxidase